MTTRKNDRRVAQEPHYLRLEKLTADRRVNDRRGPVDAIREKLAQQLQEQLEKNRQLTIALAWCAGLLEKPPTDLSEQKVFALAAAKAALEGVKQ